MGTATRIVAAVATGGTSEAARAVGKATGYDPALFNPLGATTDPSKTFKTLTDTNRPITEFGRTTPSSSAAVDPAAPVTPGQTDAERERDARLAADKRKKDFQNLGRSSTIITGPSGLLGQGIGQKKTLLGQ